MGTCWFAVWVLFVCFIGDARPQYRDKNITNKKYVYAKCNHQEHRMRKSLVFKLRNAIDSHMSASRLRAAKFISEMG
ncbi:Uncharacterized protein DBV15_10512 [Temnothorax longispinosus]|uniref:Secreted protein n=1 Tax=Temnothorax longispinosus TaxID=300112 RepID=A0A4S2KSV3_9HYME|nr:Uncharacterized protein DBV15_10512 [Temnothorax longispinosus]